MFQEELNRKAETATRYMTQSFFEEDNLQKNIYEAMKYSLFAGGKRIRPVLAMASAELFGEEKSVLPFACALEMIHTYSLIHDDLPCMDDDDLRRGKPTNHVVFGEAMAVLAGDALLTRAFELAVKKSEISAAQTLSCIRILSEAAGTEGMIGGQVIDLESEGKTIPPETLYAMHKKKTGALIKAAVLLGAEATGADQEDKLRLGSYAENLGIAFQIKDDILDVEGDAQLLGKNTGMDQEQQKTTFVSIYGLEKSKSLLREYTKNAKDVLSFYGKKADFLSELANYLLSRNN